MPTPILHLPDVNEVILMTDEPVECGICGSRTEWQITGGENGQQVHVCINPDCKYSFYAEWDPDELDDQGNWVDPNGED